MSATIASNEAGPVAFMALVALMALMALQGSR
jgi:hypothetical protein